jgi:hypothetical protein
MPTVPPRILLAGQREVGGTCAHCSRQIEAGQQVALCNQCGELHHEVCWSLKQRCGSYECSAGSGALDQPKSGLLQISRDELSAVTPMPSRQSFGEDTRTGSRSHPTPRWNKTSIWALVIALVGIPLFGLVTGLVAMVVACIALAGHRHGTRGVALAVMAILIGLADVAGWAVGLSYYLASPIRHVSLDTLALDPESLDDLPDHIARAMRANVLIHSSAGLGRESIGSGVVLSVRDDTAYIVTNRHVVDSHYSESMTTVPDDLSSLGRIVIDTLGDTGLVGKVEWIAPGGVDLAIVSAPAAGKGVRAATWDLANPPKVSEKVFAIGNPHGFGWTHSAGDISQMRRQTQGGYSVRILQTTAAINPGNSGGGLYDEGGQLIGVNTMTGDKLVAEGLSFAISLATLLDLAPSRLIDQPLDTEASSE